MSCHTSADLIDTSVSQGPEFLYNILRCPGTPARGLVWVAFAAAIGLVGWRLSQSDWTIESDEHREMLAIGAYIAAIATATIAVMRVTSWPYAVDVAVGVVSGYLPVFLANVWGARWIARRTTYAREQRLGAGWAGVAMLAWFGPMLAASPEGTGIPLSGGRMFLVAIALGMILYSWIQYADRERSANAVGGG